MKKNLSSVALAALTVVGALCIAGPAAAQVAGGTTTVDATVAGLRSLNHMVEGTNLPRLNVAEIEKLIYRDGFSLLGLT